MASHAIIQTGRDSFVHRDGNVIIRTSDQPSGTFLIRQDVLAARSLCFASFFSPIWGAQRGQATTGEGVGLQVYELDLYFDHETGFALLTADVSNSSTRRTQFMPY